MDVYTRQLDIYVMHNTWC